MQAVFKINGKDFTALLDKGGIRWSRNDLDAEQTGRDLTGRMRRKRVAIKRKMTFTCLRMDQDTIVALNEALLPHSVSITYLDPIEGVCTRVFYGSSVEATTQVVVDGITYWEGATFSLIEM